MSGVHPETPMGEPAGGSFEDMLADPNEQFDLRSELLASITAYAAAPPASAGTQPREPDRPPGQVSFEEYDRATRDALILVTQERDDARRQLADVQHGAGAFVRDAVARATDELRADRDGLRLERAAAIAQRDELQALINAGQPALASELLAARQQLADDELTHAEYRQTALEQLTSARAELATCRERNAAIAAQSDRYRDERDEARAVVAEIDTALGPKPIGISNPQRARWRKTAGLEPS